jgi:hypothetical protein
MSGLASPSHLDRLAEVSDIAGRVLGVPVERLLNRLATLGDDVMDDAGVIPLAISLVRLVTRVTPF